MVKLLAGDVHFYGSLPLGLGIVILGAVNMFSHSFARKSSSPHVLLFAL